MDEQSEFQDIGLYPNPAHSFITVSHRNQAVLSYEILDLTGRKLRNVNVVNSKTVTIPVENLLPGTYLIRLTLVDGSEIVRKIIKI
jgi:hypothetical protein